MNKLLETMVFPVDNLLGLFLYAVLFIIVTGGLSTLVLYLIPNQLGLTIKSAIVGTTVFIALLLWWYIVVV